VVLVCRQFTQQVTTMSGHFGNPNKLLTSLSNPSHTTFLKDLKVPIVQKLALNMYRKLIGGFVYRSWEHVLVHLDFDHFLVDLYKRGSPILPSWSRHWANSLLNGVKEEHMCIHVKFLTCGSTSMLTLKRYAQNIVSHTAQHWFVVIKTKEAVTFASMAVSTSYSGKT